MTKTEMVAKKEALQTIDHMLKANMAKLNAALPANIPAERMARLFLGSIRKSKKLMACTIESLWESMLEAANCGWEIGGPVPMCYLVPFKTECTLIPSYRGLMNLALASGCRMAGYGVVREGDRFEPPTDILSSQLIHVKATDAERPKRPITHVFAGYKLANGERVYEIRTTAEIDAHKEQYSPGWKKEDHAWQTNWEAMAVKTVLKKPILDGRVPIAGRYQETFARELANEPRELMETYEPSAAIGFEPSVTPPETKPETPPSQEELLAEEWRLFQNQVSETMGHATTLTQVNAIVDDFNDQFQGEAHAKYIFEMAQTRRGVIRGNRGGKAKADAS